MRPAFSHLDRVSEEIETVFKSFKVIKRMPGQDTEIPELKTPTKSKVEGAISPNHSDSSNFKTPPHKFKQNEGIKKNLFLKFERAEREEK